MATTALTKEMVDLIAKIKKHLRDKYQISIALADPLLMDKLVELRTIEDPLLQGMLRYLMALAGGDWSAKFDGRTEQPEEEKSPIEPAMSQAKKLFGRYRGHSGDMPVKAPGTSEASGEAVAADSAPKKPVRYYRGQPISED